MPVVGIIDGLNVENEDGGVDGCPVTVVGENVGISTGTDTGLEVSNVGKSVEGVLEGCGDVSTGTMVAEKLGDVLRTETGRRCG